MARDETPVSLPKDIDGTKEGLLYRREYAPMGWSARHGMAFWPWKSSYKELAATPYTESISSSDDDDPRTFPVPTHSQRRQYCRVAVIAASILLIVAYVVATAPTLIKAMIPPRTYSCGNTIEEAVSHGCTFDPVTVQWLPAQCTRAGIDEFLVSRAGNDSSPDREKTWRYWKDGDEIQEYPRGLKDAPLGHHTYYTTKGEHLAHCAYMLIRGARAREGGLLVDTLSSGQEHTEHCALFLFEAARNDPKFDIVNVVGDIQIGSC